VSDASGSPSVGHWLGRAAGTLLGERYPFVLCYHGVGRIGGADPHGLFVTPEMFGEHLDAIQSRRYELSTVGELWGRVRDDAHVRGRGAISFDDGLAQTTRVGVTMLLGRGLPCSMYIAPGLLGRPHPDLAREMIMDAREVVELAEAGVEIGSHTVDHVQLNELPFEQALDQLRRSKAVLEDMLGKPVTSLAYPYGTPNAQALRAARSAGYEFACGCTGAGPWLQFNLPREPVFPTVTRLRLDLKMAGLYGPVHRLKRLVAGSL
jgi:peptidoglycan/xylan/chitin deacetylase (PgdA/CDA1 family)